MITCKKCGEPMELEEGKLIHCSKCCSYYGIGVVPYCKGNPEDHGKPEGLEDSLEPYTDWQLDNYGDGVKITSRAQRRKIMAEQNLEYVEPKKLSQPRGRTLFFDMHKGR